jgi:hypothetical protein
MVRWIYLFGVFIILIFCISPVSNYAVAQDIENPCFFCHADLFFEIKEGVHEKNGIDCFACHGKSKEHAIAEDNRIKPETVIDSSNSVAFCGDCHNNELMDFSLSLHAKNTNNAEKVLTCLNCHEGHRFDLKINQTVCIGCHGDNSENNKSDLKIREDEIKLYQVHSLKKTSVIPR